MSVEQELDNMGWFKETGAYVLVDGQFGSTGKGLLASVIGEACAPCINIVTTNAGPNSGHTAYIGGKKVVTQQIPIAAIAAQHYLWPDQPIAYLNAGAVIDPEILMREAGQYGFNYRNLYVHPNAAVIEQQDRDAEATGTTADIASTGKGVGSALARKIMRHGNIVRNARQNLSFFYCRPNRMEWDWSKDRVFVETAQGFSLGINSVFYPYTTSRECTVQQAISDANIPYNKVRKVAACYRTFPIRVGNTELGTSGGMYPDQRETTWEEIGQEPELTTVTKRVRRVFTWSRQQFKDSVVANQPDLIFLNFCNYLPRYQLEQLTQAILADCYTVLGYAPRFLFGYGPKNEDVRFER